MKYFEIRVQAGSREELAKRVADNELRGFEVAWYYEYEKESGSYTSNNKYRTADGKSRRMRVGSYSKHYGAVMRRKNRDRVAQ